MCCPILLLTLLWMASYVLAMRPMNPGQDESTNLKLRELSLFYPGVDKTPNRKRRANSLRIIDYPTASGIKKKRQKNRNQVSQINKKFNELSEIQSELQRQLGWLKSEERINNPERVLPLIDLEGDNSKISLFKEWKLAELGVKSHIKIINSLFSNHKHDKTVQKWMKNMQSGHPGFDPNIMWTELVQAFLKEMKDTVIDYNKQFNSFGDFRQSSFRAVPAWNLKYLFKTTDLLYNSGFINEHFIRIMFREQKMISEVIHYAVYCFKEAGEQEEEIWTDFRSITKQIPWQFLDDCFQVLSETEESMINLEYLSRRIYFLGNNLNGNHPFPEWNIFCQTFRNSAMKTILHNHSNSPTYYPVKFEEDIDLKPVIHTAEEIKNDIFSLVWILHKQFEPNVPGLKISEISYAIFDYLDFIETHYFKGIIKETVGNELRAFKKFQDQKELIISLSKCLESFSTEKASLSHFFNHQDEDIYKNNLKDIELIFGKYHQNSTKCFARFCETYNKFKSNYRSSSWLDIEGPAGDIQYIFEQGEKTINYMEEEKNKIISLNKNNSQYYQPHVQKKRKIM